MPSLNDRVTARIAAVRARSHFVDHAFRMQAHYTGIGGRMQAGGVTYFAFLSFFPIMALAFFLVGYLARVYPDAQKDLTQAINHLFPGMVGHGEGQVSIQDFQKAAATAGLLGLAGLIYAGLGWLSAMRDALVDVFQLPAREQPGFVSGKLRDLISLVIIGVVLLVAVAVAGLVAGFSQDVLDWLGLGAQLSWLLVLLAIAFGLGVNMLLFFALFRLLTEPHTPTRSLWSGALLGAIGFELLKEVAGLLLTATKNQPAFQAFGVALILLVWMNYFSRVVLHAAAWAHTSRAAMARRVLDPADPLQGPPSPGLTDRNGEPHPTDGRRSWVGPFAAGGAAALGLVALLRRRSDG